MDLSEKLLAGSRVENSLKYIIPEETELEAKGRFKDANHEPTTTIIRSLVLGESFKQDLVPVIEYVHSLCSILTGEDPEEIINGVEGLLTLDKLDKNDRKARYPYSNPCTYYVKVEKVQFPELGECRCISLGSRPVELGQNVPDYTLSIIKAGNGNYYVAGTALKYPGSGGWVGLNPIKVNLS